MLEMMMEALEMDAFLGRLQVEWTQNKADGLVTLAF